MSILAEAPEAYRSAVRRDDAEAHATKRRKPPSYQAQLKAVAYVDFRRPEVGPSGSRRQACAAAWPDESAALEYAKGRLDQLKTEYAEMGLTTPVPVAEERMLQVLRSVLAPDSVFPTMSIDDDGSVIAEWRFLRRGLEIVAEPDGDVSYAIRIEGRRVGGGVSTTPLRRLIRDITAFVDRANPKWRSLFRDVNTHDR